MHDYGQHPYWQYAGDGHPFIWLLLILIFAALVVAVVVFVFRRLAPPQGFARFAHAAAGPHEDALTIVRMRYARGEIDREQYLQTTADLGGAGHTADPPLDAPTA